MRKLEAVITGRNCIYTSMAHGRSSEEKHIKQSTRDFMQILSLKNGWNSSIAVVAYMEKAGFLNQRYLLKRSSFFVVKKSRDYMARLPRVQFSDLFACNPEIDTDV